MSKKIKSRDLFIGDVHGCYDELIRLLEKCRYRPHQDRLFFVGDLINKGPKSKEVLQFVMAFANHCVMGNHEWAFLKFMRGEKLSYHFEHLKESMGRELELFTEWLENLPLFYEEENFLLVHAGLRPQVRPERTETHILLNIRTWDGQGLDLNNENHPAWFECMQTKKKIIFGHWAKRGLVNQKKFIGLDTGCVYGHKLTAYSLQEEKFFQVPAQEAYCPIEKV